MSNNPVLSTVKILEKNKDFFQMVFEVVKMIPEGRVTSYGAIASYLGSKKSSRMVGWAMNASHKIEGIPAHRVVNRDGLLTGKFHFGEPDEMQKRLNSEGISVFQNRVVDFNNLFWDPSKELNL